MYLFYLRQDQYSTILRPILIENLKDMHQHGKRGQIKDNNLGLNFHLYSLVRSFKEWNGMENEQGFKGKMGFKNKYISGIYPQNIFLTKINQATNT